MTVAAVGLAGDPAVLADADTVVELHRQRERLSAVSARVVAAFDAFDAFDASGAWEADGARSAASWLATRCRLPHASAQRRVRLGRDLRHMAATERAWLAGEVGEAHVGLLGRARTPTAASFFARDEDMLVGEATRLRFGSFARALVYWSLRAHPERAEDKAPAQHHARRLHLSQTFGGAWVAVSGTIIANELRRLEDELFRRRLGPGQRPPG